MTLMKNINFSTKECVNYLWTKLFTEEKPNSSNWNNSKNMKDFERENWSQYLYISKKSLRERMVPAIPGALVSGFCKGPLIPPPSP